MKGLIAKTRLQEPGDYYHIEAYLWRDLESMHAAIERYGVEGVRPFGPGMESFTRALHHPEPTRWRFKGKRWVRVKRRKLGELHFAVGSWDMEVVVHELAHAAFHRFRAVVVPRCKNGATMDDEESVCYPIGAWGDQLYRWLWKLDKNPKWERVAPTRRRRSGSRA